MAESIRTLTESSFDVHLETGDHPILVDFWAEWCGPCNAIAPILEELAMDLEGKLRVAKLNVDDHPDIASRFDVMTIPTLIVFEDGALTKRLVGARTKDQVLDDLAELL